MASLTKTSTIDSVEELFAHALELEREAAETYEEFATSMAFHNNREVSQLFEQLGSYARKHEAEVKELAHNSQLPRILPWEFKWPDKESPETAALEDIHYLMGPHQALAVAHRAETNAFNFYSHVSKTSPDDDVRNIAADFADEEREHVELLNEWIKRYPEPEDDWDFDPDPPSVIE